MMLKPENEPWRFLYKHEVEVSGMTSVRSLHCSTATLAITCHYKTLSPFTTHPPRASRYDNYGPIRELVGSVSVVRLIC